ncbi:F-box-like domain-containing protein [Legionella anisa]|uniref:F-box protein n=1 Tax=Legionella anisa TaxID=28082 RepID=A0AAX0WNY0_9GAMM|nr:F-box-like domain-containing protein [Legionella anisa]AWN73143.1 F-box protein [Legionella anisa]KTC67422.1 F-box-like protein [Legionella anisa]MCW8423973.1 F-box protein [Legionella anisa]MCW8447495.1 F-box protein [Legionella anisa]PNL60261.1 F-box protein [Legionella anisa]
MKRQKVNAASNNADSFPVEIFLEILKFLPPKEMQKIASLSFFFKTLANDRQLWKDFLIKTWGENNSDLIKLTHEIPDRKQLFKELHFTVQYLCDNTICSEPFRLSSLDENLKENYAFYAGEDDQIQGNELFQQIVCGLAKCHLVSAQLTSNDKIPPLLRQAIDNNDKYVTQFLLNVARVSRKQCLTHNMVADALAAYANYKKDIPPHPDIASYKLIAHEIFNNFFDMTLEKDIAWNIAAVIADASKWDSSGDQPNSELALTYLITRFGRDKIASVIAHLPTEESLQVFHLQPHHHQIIKQAWTKVEDMQGPEQMSIG